MECDAFIQCTDQRLIMTCRERALWVAWPKPDPVTGEPLAGRVYLCQKHKEEFKLTTLYETPVKVRTQ